MKEFIRLIIILLVLMIVAGMIYYAVINYGISDRNIESTRNKKNTISDKNLFDIELPEKEDINILQNQDVIVKFEHTQYSTMNMGSDLLGNSALEFLAAFEATETPVIFQKVVNNEGTKITILPMSDFLDNQEFEYDVNGDLILYTTISKTVGGNVQYIFSNNVLTQTINNMEEEIVPIFERQDEILARANRLYNL